MLDDEQRGIQLSGGRLLGAISTQVVGIVRDHYGRGPMNAKTYALDDVLVVVMRGSGLTPLERTILAAGDSDRVVALRHEFQEVIAARFKAVVEELTGRTVVAFMSRASVDPDVTIEIFVLDRPLGEPADQRAVAGQRH